MLSVTNRFLFLFLFRKRGNVYEWPQKLEPWCWWRGPVAQREVCWWCPWSAGPSGQLSDDSRQYLAVTVVCMAACQDVLFSGSLYQGVMLHEAEPQNHELVVDTDIKKFWPTVKYTKWSFFIKWTFYMQTEQLWACDGVLFYFIYTMCFFYDCIIYSIVSSHHFAHRVKVQPYIQVGFCSTTRQIDIECVFWHLP